MNTKRIILVVSLLSINGKPISNSDRVLDVTVTDGVVHVNKPIKSIEEHMMRLSSVYYEKPDALHDIPFDMKTHFIYDSSSMVLTPIEHTTAESINSL